MAMAEPSGLGEDQGSGSAAEGDVRQESSEATSPETHTPEDTTTQQPERPAGWQDPKDYKTWQGKFSRKTAELESYRKKVGSLEPWIDQIGAQPIVDHLTRYAALRDHPAFKTAILEFERTGMLPASLNAASADEEYLSPEQKEIRELRNEIASLRGQQAQVTQQTAKQTMKDHLGRFFSEWSDLEEGDRQQISDGLTRAFEDFAKTPNGQQILTSPRYETIRTIALQQLSDAQIVEAGKRRHLRELRLQKGAATDEPSSVRTTGRERRNDLAISALEALQEAKREAGVSDLPGLRR
jgi:hypothetical protein